MGKSTVERYEQILAQDPSSAVFVELAKALIDQRNNAGAIEVCRSGLAHHPDSIIGRVLWGRALINLGRPAEAIEQFDRALAVGRDNPHAYSLIAEVLLRRGLYRSALPLLKKAVSLQPNNGRLRQWLDETQRAAQGGPPPVLADTEPDEHALEPSRQRADVGIPAYQGRPADAKVFVAAYSQETTATFDASQLAAQMNSEDPEQTSQAQHTADPFEAFPPAPAGILRSPAHGTPVALTESGIRRALLEDVAEVPEVATAVEPPKAQVSSHEAQEIARQYERELRQELQERTDELKRSLLARHGIKIAAATVLGVALVVGLGFYLSVRAANHGRDLKDDLAQARKAIAQDTRKSYALALDRLSHAVKMDEDSEEAWALTAVARGILFAEHGGAAEDREKGTTALQRAHVRERFPGIALTSDFYLTDPARRGALVQSVLDSKLDQAEVHELAGRLLLSRKDSKAAVDRFRRALALSAANVRALVALGDYYRESGDPPTALKFYGTAGQISPAHPGIVLGAAESRLELSADLEDALKEIEALPKDEILPPEQLARKELALGRLLVAHGAYDEAIKKLSEGTRAFKSRAFEFDLALGDASRASGRIDAAQQAYEAALALRPRSEEAKEAVGRALIARDRERELLSRFPGEPDARRIALVRGVALAKLGDWRRARAELVKTQVNGKFPSEAAIYLASADAVEGQPERAQAVLEKLSVSSRKAKSEVRVALGNVYWQRGLLDKARSQFEEALKDPEDYEGACSLGRLLLSTGSSEAALEPLRKAVARNGFHGEARRALGRAYLEMGKLPEAIAQLESWRADQPGSIAAHKSLAHALFRAGKLKDAEAAISRAVGLDPNDAEARRIRSQILFARGDGRTAFADLEKAGKLAPADPETSCELGAAYVRQNRFDAAAKAYEAARRQNPESFCGRIGAHYARLPAGSKGAAKELGELAQRAPEFWNRSFALSTLARVLLSSGLLKEARKSAEQSVSLYPLSGGAHFALGAVAQRQKEESRAREELAKAVELDPTHAGAHLVLADALARNDEMRAQAVEHYQWYLRLGATGADQLRVKRALANLKKKLALR